MILVRKAATLTLIPNFFYVINERLLRNKSVIISSNFTISQIEDFYSERIFSRIISSYTILRLFGTDIRYLKRTKMLKN